NGGIMTIYSREEMVYDCKKFKDVIVFDTNTSCILELDLVGRRIKHEFPEVLKFLQLYAIKNKLLPGSSFVFDVRGYKIVALITQVKIYGDDIDDFEVVALSTINAIKDMFKKISKDLNFKSGILNRGNKSWNIVEKYIRKQK